MKINKLSMEVPREVLDLTKDLLTQEQKEISKIKTSLILNNWIPWWERDINWTRCFENDFMTLCNYSNEVNKAKMQVMKVLEWKQEYINDNKVIETISEELDYWYKRYLEKINKQKELKVKKHTQFASQPPMILWLWKNQNKKESNTLSIL